MVRGFVALAGLLACACAPGPAPMAASEASERLERFAAGSSAEDVCTPQGRSLLRGAVRAYGAELARAGVAWPALPDGDGQALRSVDAAVAVAFAAGFVEASDFQAQARGAVARIALTHWPHMRDMRAATRVACGQVVDVQRAALRLVSEMERTQRMVARAERDRNPERLRRQRERVENAEAQLEAMAAALQRQIEEARRGG